MYVPYLSGHVGVSDIRFFVAIGASHMWSLPVRVLASDPFSYTVYQVARKITHSAHLEG